MNRSIVFLAVLFLIVNIGCSGDEAPGRIRVDQVSPDIPESVSIAKAGAVPASFLQNDAEFRLGRDRLFTTEYIDLVKDKNVAIMANITAKKTVDMLIDASYVTLKAIFAPEHGFFGKTAAGLHVDDDMYRGVPIYGCYGGGDETRRIPQNLLEGIDVLVFEVQDIGARYYTYISSMYLAMDSAADAGIKFVVLDRPNPAGGNVEGPVLEPENQSFLGVGGFPICYGMTIGELAVMFRDETGVMHGPRYPRLFENDAYYNVRNLDLVVVPMTGYDRTKPWEELMGSQEWISTSPNIPSVVSAICFAGTGLMAGNTIDEIVPDFQQFQALAFPFIHTGEEMQSFIFAAKKEYDFPGVILSPAVHLKTFKENIIVLEVYDRTAFRPVATALALMYTQRKLYPDERFLTNEKAEELSRKVIGNTWVFGMMLQKPLPPFQAIMERIKAEEFDFNRIRWQYLMY